MSSTEQTELCTGDAQVPFDKATGSLQAVLHRAQRGLQYRGGSHTGSLSPDTALSAHPAPASSSQGRVARL